MDQIDITYMGTIDFDSAMKLQMEEKEKVSAGTGNGRILVLSHNPPVITLGRHCGIENLKLSENHAV